MSDVTTTDPTQKVWDCIIVGGGAAGLAAGVYCGRARMSTLLIEGLTTGGEASRTDVIENYPGFNYPIKGPELMEKFREHAEMFGTIIEYAQIEKVYGEGDLHLVRADDGRIFKAYSVILATGTHHKTLDCPGEQEFLNAGVSYCATCDGPFFKDVPIAVIGGGDSAVEEGTYLTRFASKVYIIHRRDKLRATKIAQERAMANPKVEFIWNSTVEAVEGDKTVKQIKLKNSVTGDVTTLPVEGVFVFIGMLPNTWVVDGYVNMTEMKQIITDECMRTSRPGVYAAGDNRVHSYRQVATAVGDAVTAAIDAEKYVEALKHRIGVGH